MLVLFMGKSRTMCRFLQAGLGWAKALKTGFLGVFRDICGTALSEFRCPALWKLPLIPI
jgi:hypothetical protein